MCIIVSWGLTLYQGYIILTAWYPLQPYHLITRTSKMYRFPNHLHHRHLVWKGLWYFALKNSSVHIYLFFPSVVLWKQAKYTCSETCKPNKGLDPICGNSNFERLTHKQLRIDITFLTPRAFLLIKKKKKCLKVFELAHVALYHVVLDMKWVFRVLWHKISTLC